MNPEAIISDSPAASHPRIEMTYLESVAKRPTGFGWHISIGTGRTQMKMDS